MAKLSNKIIGPPIIFLMCSECQVWANTHLNLLSSIAELLIRCQIVITIVCDFYEWQIFITRPLWLISGTYGSLMVRANVLYNTESDLINENRSSNKSLVTIVSSWSLSSVTKIDLNGNCHVQEHLLRISGHSRSFIFK